MEAQTFTQNDEMSTIVTLFGRQLANPDRPFTLLGRFRIQNGKHDLVESLFAEARVPTVLEKGCLAFEISRHADDAGQFVVYEKWLTLADLDAHLHKPYTSKLRSAFDALIVGTPEFNVLVSGMDTQPPPPRAGVEEPSANGHSAAIERQLTGMS